MEHFCDSIDDYLGPVDHRFFGAGYKRATYHVSDIYATTDLTTNAGVIAKLTVQYPIDWSKKNNSELSPHLSSIDTLVLSAELCEVFLVHAYSLNEQMRRNMRLIRVQLRSGSAPQEDLNDLNMAVKWRATQDLNDKDGIFLSIFDCHIGTMRSTCTIEHVIQEHASYVAQFASLSAALGDAAYRYFGEGFKQQKHVIKNVKFDRTTMRAQAIANVIQLPGTSCSTQGIEGADNPRASMVDCFVLNLQLAQILMYELDSIKRENSNTLWMLQTILDVKNDDHGYHSESLLQTEISKSHLLQLNGSDWRNVDVCGSYGGISLRASLAHQLPNRISACSREEVIA